MFYRARRAMHRRWFDMQCRSLLRTPPLESNDDTLTIVSMVCHGECIMYLLAVKSFCHRLGRVPAIVVLNDGSLTAVDVATIKEHLPGATVYHIASVNTGECPKGNCWERLLLISDLVRQSYVIQVDCDTLTLTAIPEVEACLQREQSFTLLGDRSHPAVLPMLDAWVTLRDNPSTQVQAVCERAFHLLPQSSNLKYLRGNAGFTGFAKGSIDREKITWFSHLMSEVAEGKWDEWGSEQLTSNLLIANTINAQPLPSPKYISYWNHPEIDYNDSAFIHFIGPYRFANGFYLGKARSVIQEVIQEVIQGIAG